MKLYLIYSLLRAENHKHCIILIRLLLSKTKRTDTIKVQNISEYLYFLLLRCNNIVIRGRQRRVQITESANLLSLTAISNGWKAISLKLLFY